MRPRPRYFGLGPCLRVKASIFGSGEAEARMLRPKPRTVLQSKVC